jgi:hypothetical protein
MDHDTISDMKVRVVPRSSKDKIVKYVLIFIKINFCYPLEKAADITLLFSDLAFSDAVLGLLVVA